MFRIIMVDDEPWALRGIREIIDWERFDFTSVRTFLDPAEALRAIVEDCPDVVCTDVRMPGMSGLELIERCREAGCNPVFVIISAYAEFEYARRAMESGAFSYLLKPHEEEQVTALAEKLRSALMQSKEKALLEAARSLVLKALTTGKAASMDPLLKQSGIFRKPYRIGIAAMRQEDATGAWFPIFSDLALAVLPAEVQIAVTAPLGMSQAASGSALAPKRVREALIAYYTLCFYGGQSGTLFFQETGAAYTVQAVNDIVGAVACGNAAGAHTLIGKMYCRAVEQHILISELTFFYNGLLRGLFSIASQQEVQVLQENLRSFSSCFQMYGVMHTADTLFESIRVLADDCMPNASEHTEPRDAIEHAVRFVDAHFHETITLEQLSKQFNISLSHLCRQFKRVTGKPYTEYVAHKRIARAGELLRRTQLPISEIGEQVGYPDYFYFSKVFKKVAGVSPSVFRRERQNHAQT